MSAIIDALQSRYSHEAGWLLVFELRNARGFGANRSVDAVAIPLWLSRGGAIHGFEIKESRADWLRELKNPAKAENVMAPFDRWWLVTTDGVAKREEIPDPWGWLLLNGSRLIVQKEAKELRVDRTEVFWLLVIKKLATQLLASVPSADVNRLVHEKLLAIEGSRRERDDRAARSAEDMKKQQCAELQELKEVLGASYSHREAIRSAAALRKILDEYGSVRERVSLLRKAVERLHIVIDSENVVLPVALDNSNKEPPCVP